MAAGDGGFADWGYDWVLEWSGYGKGVVFSSFCATGADGYKSVMSLGEVDPAFHPGMVLVVDTLDGKPLDAKTIPVGAERGQESDPGRVGPGGD